MRCVNRCEGAAQCRVWSGQQKGPDRVSAGQGPYLKSVGVTGFELFTRRIGLGLLTCTVGI